MDELEAMRTAVVLALRDQSPEELAATIGGVTPNTVRNFSKPGHGLRGPSRRAFESWYRRSQVTFAPLPTATPPAAVNERSAFYAGVAAGLTHSIRRHLASAMTDADQLLAQLQRLADDSTATPSSVGVPPAAGAAKGPALTPNASPERLEQRTADQSTPDTLADAAPARAQG